MYKKFLIVFVFLFVVVGFIKFSAFATTFTPPTISTGSASNITSTSAVLSGGVNGNGSNVTASFKYSSTNYPNPFGDSCSDYDVNSTVVNASPSSFSNDRTISATITGLLPGTTYHYTSVAKAGNDYCGGYLSFTTLPAESVTISPSTTTLELKDGDFVGSFTVNVHSNTNGEPACLVFPSGHDVGSLSNRTDIFSVISRNIGTYPNLCGNGGVTDWSVKIDIKIPVENAVPGTHIFKIIPASGTNLPSAEGSIVIPEITESVTVSPNPVTLTLSSNNYVGSFTVDVVNKYQQCIKFPIDSIAGVISGATVIGDASGSITGSPALGFQQVCGSGKYSVNIPIKIPSVGVASGSYPYKINYYFNSDSSPTAYSHSLTEDIHIPQVHYYYHDYNLVPNPTPESPGLKGRYYFDCTSTNKAVDCAGLTGGGWFNQKDRIIVIGSFNGRIGDYVGFPSGSGLYVDSLDPRFIATITYVSETKNAIVFTDDTGKNYSPALVTLVQVDNPKELDFSNFKSIGLYKLETVASQVNLGASPSSITLGQKSTLSWASSNMGSCDGVGFDTGGAIKGSVSVTPTSLGINTYSINCYSNGVRVVGNSTTINVVAPIDPATIPASIVVSANPTVFTINDTDIQRVSEIKTTPIKIKSGSVEYDASIVKNNAKILDNSGPILGWSNKGDLGATLTIGAGNAQAGTYKILVNADGISSIDGKSVPSNTVTITVTINADAVSNLPDVTASVVSPFGAVLNNETTFSSVISNVGSGSISNFPYFFQTATGKFLNIDNRTYTYTGVADIANSKKISLDKYNDSHYKETVTSKLTFSSEGIVYVRVCANKSDSNNFGPTEEQDTDNNCSFPWTEVRVTKTAIPDLTAGPVSPTSVTSGAATKFIADITNIGTASTGNGNSFPYFFQTTNALDSKGNGVEPIIPDSTKMITDKLDVNKSTTATSSSFTFNTGDTPYVRVCANKSDANTFGTEVSEPVTLRDDNCGDWTQITVTDKPEIPKPDLTAGPVMFKQADAVVGNSIVFTSIISNIGTASTGNSFYNSLQIADDVDGIDPVFPLDSQHSTPALDIPGTGNDTANVFASHSFSVARDYSVRFCADENTNMVGSIPESDEDHNCSGWTNITIEPKPVNGGWGAAPDCPTACGLSASTSSGVCNNPPPQNGGSICPASSQPINNCSATPACAVDTCGSSVNGKSFVSLPTTGLCGEGTQQNLILTNGKWTWNCGTASCSASKKKIPHVIEN